MSGSFPILYDEVFWDMSWCLYCVLRWIVRELSYHIFCVRSCSNVLDSFIDYDELLVLKVVFLNRLLLQENYVSKFFSGCRCRTDGDLYWLCPMRASCGQSLLSVVFDARRSPVPIHILQQSWRVLLFDVIICCKLTLTLTQHYCRQLIVTEDCWRRHRRLAWIKEYLVRICHNCVCIFLCNCACLHLS